MPNCFARSCMAPPLLVPAHFDRATSTYEAAIREELMTPLRLSAVDELRWYFEMKEFGLSIDAGERERFARAGRAFDAPRYLALYRRWIELGPTALDAVSSSSLADAIDRGIGRLNSSPSAPLFPPSLVRQYCMK